MGAFTAAKRAGLHGVSRLSGIGFYQLCRLGMESFDFVTTERRRAGVVPPVLCIKVDAVQLLLLALK